MNKPFVRVVWHDASDSGKTWNSETDLNDAWVEVTSFGFLLKKSKRFLHIGADVVREEGSEDLYGTVRKIPRKMVVLLELLECTGNKAVAEPNGGNTTNRRTSPRLLKVTALKPALPQSHPTVPLPEPTSPATPNLQSSQHH